MGLPSEIKPLFANLRRIGLLEYIGLDEFEDLMIELDYDEEWNEALAETGDMEEKNDYSDAQYDEAFINFLDWLYHNENFIDFVYKLIYDYSKWKPEQFEIHDIYENFKDLEVRKKDLLEFQKEFRKIRDSKPKNVFTKDRVELDSKKVFIVHGHDKVALRELEKFLKDDLKLDPVILQDQLTDSIETIINKLERVAGDCLYSIVLMTPDDETLNNQKRARQNVVLELGYFIGRYSALGYGKVVLIKKGDIEKPSDIEGVIYYPYSNNIEEVFYKLSKQFQAWKEKN